MTIRVNHLHADRLLLGAAQFKERVDHASAAAALGAGKVASGLLDKGHENRVEREIVSEIVETGSEKQYVALSDLLFQQQRRPIRQAGGDAGITGVHADRKIKLHAGPTVSLRYRRIRRVGFPYGEEAVACA